MDVVGWADHPAAGRHLSRPAGHPCLSRLVVAGLSAGPQPVALLVHPHDRSHGDAGRSRLLRAAAAGGRHAGRRAAVRRHAVGHQEGVDGRTLPDQRPVPCRPVGAPAALCALASLGARCTDHSRRHLVRAQPALPLVEPAGGPHLRGPSVHLSHPVGGQLDPRQFMVDRRREPHLQPGRERAHERPCHASLFLDGRPSPEDIYPGRGQAGDRCAACAPARRGGSCRPRARRLCRSW